MSGSGGTGDAGSRIDPGMSGTGRQRADGMVGTAPRASRPAVVGATRFDPRLHAVPVLLVGALVVTALCLNASVGLVLRPTPLLALPPTLALCAAGSIYLVLDRAPRLGELALYAGLWICYPPFGTLLSYLGVAAGLPLQDGTLAAADAAFGFDWLTWTRFVSAHPLLWDVQAFAYMSYTWQPLASVAVFAFCRPGYRVGASRQPLAVSARAHAQRADAGVGPRGRRALPDRHDRRRVRRAPRDVARAATAARRALHPRRPNGIGMSRPPARP